VLTNLLFQSVTMKLNSFIDLGRWIHMKVGVEGAKASLYLDHAAKPALLVSNLKYGAGQQGGALVSGSSPGPSRISRT
jgi:hypothetical protein